MAGPARPDGAQIREVGSRRAYARATAEGEMKFVAARSFADPANFANSFRAKTR
jgi:hypothetical protein